MKEGEESLKVIEKSIGTADWFPVKELILAKGKLQQKNKRLQMYLENPVRLKGMIAKQKVDIDIYNKNIRALIGGLGGLPEKILEEIKEYQKSVFQDKIDLLEGMKIE